MKQLSLYLLLILVFILNTKLNAQKPTIQEIDFADLQTKYKYTFPFKSSVQIRFRNINRRVYKVEDEKSEEDFNTSLPDALKGLKLPNFLFTMPIPSSQDKAASPAAVATEMAEVVLQNPEATIKQLIAAIEQKAKRLNEAVIYYNDINRLSKDCFQSTNSILTSLNSRTTNFLYATEGVLITNKELLGRLRDTLFVQRKDAESLLGKLKQTINNYTKGMNELIDVKNNNIDNVLTGLRNELDKAKTKKEKENIQKKVDIRIAAIEKLKSEKESLKKVTSEMDENLKKAKDIVDAMFEFDKDDKLNIISKAFAIFTNPKNYEYSSEIIIPDKDETKLKITVTPQELNECTGADKKPTEIKIRTEGGLKVDVSSGAFVNGGNEDFLGNTYYYQKLTDDTRQIITAKRNNRLMLSVGALFHLYKRSPSNLKLSGSLGVSTTAGFDELNFHVGPSLIIGDKNRFIITTGITLKSSKVLDQQLEINTSYKSGETPDEIPVVSEFPKLGWFIGITYNLNIFK